MELIKIKSYKDFWYEKEEYGVNRFLRMIKRKEERHFRRSTRSRGFKCEMRYGDCERRGYCNGDC